MKNKTKIKVSYSNFGLANYYGDCIEINRALKSNKPLRDYIIHHELGHSQKFDLVYEIIDGLKLIGRPKIYLKLLSFCLFHPSTWIDFLPIQIKRKQIVYDINLLILYIIGATIIILLALFGL